MNASVNQKFLLVRTFLEWAENKNSLTLVGKNGKTLAFRYIQKTVNDTEIYVGIKIEDSEYSICILRGEIYRLYVCMDGDEKSAYLPAEDGIRKLENFFLK